MSEIVEYPEKAEELGFLINHEREKLGLQPLYTFAYLKECANIRAKESSTYFSHTRPDGYFYSSVVDYDIIPWAYIGENLAGGAENAAGALELWRNSPKHWQTITRPEYTHIGCAVCYNPNGDGGYNWYWCTIFTNEWDVVVYDGQYLPNHHVDVPPREITIESYGVDENSVQTFVNGAQYELTFLGNGTLEKVICDGTDVLFSEKSVIFTANSVVSVKYLPAGKYQLIELEPPEDHKKVQEITFSIVENGDVTDLRNAIPADNTTIKIVHSRNPIELHPLERHNVIKVYDLSYRQEDFGNGNNGLAVLHPSECTSTKNADVWDISLVHPLDEWGKWKNLLPENVLEVRGQLFRIDEQTINCSENGNFITVHARHISGDMADDLIENATFEGGTAQNFIDFAFSKAVTPFDEKYFEEHPDDYYHKPYVFTGYSDIETFLDGCDYTNTSLLGAIKGVDNCLVNRYGGELYRNNFYFSVCKRMENARDNAFVIRFSDVSGVSQCVDYTDFCTNLNCYDNFGNSFSVSYTGASRDIIHHARRKMYKFNYKEEHTAFTQLGIDGMALWAKISTPKVSYTVNFCSAKSDPRFTDFAVLQNFDYGDKGRIYCPEISIDTEQQIVEVVTNELTGEIISMKLGNVVDTLVRPDFLGSTITTGRSISDNLDVRVSKLELANTTEKTS